MEKELRAEITPKSVPDIFRHIFKLPYLTVTCELDLQYLLLRPAYKSVMQELEYVPLDQR